MNLGKKIAILAIVGSVAATGALAKGNMGTCNGTPKMAQQQMQQGMMGAKMGHKGQRGSMRMLQGLNLTPEQTHELRLAQAQMRVEMIESMTPGQKPMMMQEAFSASGFDKEAFVEARVKNAKAKSELKAKHIEKVYNILTPEQQEQFVKNMERTCPRS
jgi:Spy/CpxP family protein refolding chaperone